MSDDFRGKGGSPWGSPPGGGSGNGSGRGPTPPNIDELIKDIQDKIKKFLPGGKTSGGKSISLILLVLAFVWLASGLYRRARSCFKIWKIYKNHTTWIELSYTFSS